MANKSFQVSIDFIGNVSDLQSKIRQVTGEINKIGSTSGGAAVQKQFDQLTKSVTDLQTRINQPIKTQGDFNKIAGEVQKIELSYNNLIQTIQRLQSASDGKKLELLPADQQNKIKQAEQAVENYEKTINRAGGSLKKFQELQDKKADKQGALSAAKKNIKDYETALDSVKKKLEELNAEEAKLTGDKTKADKRVKSLQGQISNQRTSQEVKEAASSALPEAKAQAQELEGSLARVNQQKKQLNEKQTGLTESLTTARKEAGTAEAAIKSINAQIKQLGGDSTQALQSAFNDLKQKAADLKVNLEGIGKDATAANVEMLTSRLRALKGEGLEQADAAIIKMANDLEAQLGGALQKNRSHVEQATQAWGQFMTAQEDVSMLQNRLKYFFSLTNSIQLLKRTIQSSINTVKELDKVMTETAVVTDFSIGDMWDKLPEYASKASALGSSIKDLYAATTLYYQQGLNSEQAMGIGVETMKMARIAGMDAADATQAMTAALRGFNMEVNEVNAQRVNDVYSELAAITAADTEQIATAMSKTASIAKAANMEFETTSALLAQIIETTQEAPETAGTAMKTIIARFTEVKELFSEGMLTGEDEEGEEININKIDAALRTVGISLKDFLNGSKGIDDIFLELASKWDTLDLATQRYIATTAAGSRQQSRFIAMMSNYDRTMELVTAANNSAGASQEQFDKTMESLEAKLQQLQNAWNQFTMGIANSDAIKGGIDLLTSLLETVNKLMDALSGGSGAGKGLLSLMSVVGALKGGKALLEGGFGFIGRAMGIPQSPNVTEKEAGAFQRARQYSKQGSTFKQKAGYYATGLFNKKENAAFDQKIKELQEEREELDAYSRLNYRASKSEGIITQLKGTDSAISELKDIQSEFEKTGQVSAESAKKLEQYGLSAQDVARSVYPLRTDLQAVGAAAMLAGGAFGLLANVLEKNGMDKGAEACRTLSTAMMGLGSVLMLLPTVLGGSTVAIKAWKLVVLDASGANAVFTASLGWIAVAIVAVIAVVWILVAAFKAIYAASPEGKLEAATEAANDAAEAAESAAQAYEHLASALDSIEGKSAALENLAVGTTEWKNAVQELNGEVLDLVEKYPELAKYVDSSKGYLSFKEVDGKTVQDELETYQDNKFKAQSASAAAKLNKQKAQTDYDFSTLSYDVKKNYTTTRAMAPEEISRQTMQAVMTGADYGIVPIVPSATPYAAGQQAYTTTDFDREVIDQLARDLASGKLAPNDEAFAENGRLYGFTDTESEAYKELLRYGQGLLQDDAANKVYADALKANALATTEVSQDNKANMMNFLGADQVSDLADSQYDAITKAWNDMETGKAAMQGDKDAYARIMGYEYDKAKDRFLKDGQEVEVSDESIKRQLAGVKTQEELNKKMVALDGVLDGIKDTGEGTQSAFKAMTEKGEGAAMTLDELKAAEALNSEEIENLRSGLGLGSVYTEEEFANFFTESAKLAREQFNKASEQLTTIGMGDYLADKNLDTGQTKAVSDLLYTTAVQSGTEAAGNLGGLISEQLKNADYGDIFAQALEMINVKDIDSVRKLSEYMEELGYAGDIDFDGIEEEIIKATNASKNFNLDNVKEQLKSTQDLVKDIKDREETDRVYSEEDYKKLIASGVDSKKFVMTGIDEYTYIGETNEQLVAALQENTAALLGETQEQLREAAEKSQTWEDLRSGEDTKGQYDLLGDIATGKKKIESVAPYLLETAMGAVGLSTEEFASYSEDDGWDSSTIKILTDRIASAWNTYGSANAITGNLNAWETYGQQSLPQMYYSQMTGQQILSTQQAYKDEEGNVLGAEEDWAARKGALDAKLVWVDGGQAEATKVFEDLRNQYENTAEAAERYETAVKAAVIDNDKLEKKMTSLADSIEDNADALKKGEKGGKEYQKALDKIAAEAKAVFGENYTKEFVEENLPLFLDWAEGVEGSADKIRDALLNSTEASFNNIEQLRSNIAALDGTTLEIYGYANMSDAIGSLYQTEEEAAKAAADINALGMYSATVVSRGSHEENGVVVPNGWDVVVSKAGANVEGSRGGGGGGGGGGGEEKSWENPYDKLYNLTEKINQSLREREKIERRYERMIERRQATAADLQRIAQEEIDNLEEQAKLQQDMIDGRREMIQEELDENSDLQKYATFDMETGEITIDWEKINAVTDEEEGSRIEEYISKLEELRDSLQEAEDALEEIEDAVWEIEQRGREEYLEFEERVKEAIVASREKEIESLEKINESINDTNSELLDAIQDSIDKMRQDRENEETEKDLTEKQRELAYLQQDTSGANAMRILELQEEIRQGKQDYTDTLIDQKISELQEQNDKAAEQREKQITLLQNQLDADIESGRIWTEVQDLMENGIDGQGSLINGSTLVNILKSAEGWDAMSEIGQMDWLSTLETMVAESMNWRMTHGQLENRPNVKSGDTITFKDANGKEITGTVDGSGNVWVDDSNYYKGVYEWIDGAYHTTETSATKYVKPKPASSGGGGSSDEGGKSGGKQYPYHVPGVPGAYSTPEEASAAAIKYAQNNNTKVDSSVQNYTNGNKIADVYANPQNNSYSVKKYKTGGLADFTGPAWLDGTKSRPELVLNQRDTQNFIQLKDILSSIMSHGVSSNHSNSTENNGDITYDIDINVETMRSDYDVEQVASKIKSMINEDARYRNNNAVSLKR